MAVRSRGAEDRGQPVKTDIPDIVETISVNSPLLLFISERPDASAIERCRRPYTPQRVKNLMSKHPPSLQPSYASPNHRGLAEAAHAAALRLSALPGTEVAIARMLVGEARRLSDGRPVEFVDLDVLAEELLAAHERTGLAEVRDLHAAVVALSIEVERSQSPAPAGFVPSGRRGPSGL